MRAILKEGLLPENNADSYSQSSDFEGSEQEEDAKLQDVEMKEDKIEAPKLNSKQVKNRQAYFGGFLFDQNASRFVDPFEQSENQVKTFNTEQFLNQFLPQKAEKKP